MRPTMRDDTVTKMKPKTMTSTATRILLRRVFPGTKGSATSTTTRPMLPTITVTKDRSRSVRIATGPPLSPVSDRMLSRSEV
jgi:hypothetical protein